MSHADAPRASVSAAWLFRQIDLTASADDMTLTAWQIIDREPPGSVTSGMKENTKPFVLWNVDRHEGFDPFVPTQKDRITYEVGGACSEKARDREGMPGKTRFATRELVSEIEDRAFLRSEAFGRQRRFRAIITSDLAAQGLGKSEE